MFQVTKQACNACLQTFSLFRSEHQCDLCGEVVCRTCLASGSERFRPWRRSTSGATAKVCKLCNRSTHSKTCDEIQLMTSQPCIGWGRSPTLYTPAQSRRRATTPLTRTYASSIPATTRARRQPPRHEIFCPKSLATERKYKAWQDFHDRSAAEAKHDQEILTVDTDDMKKASANASFMGQIHSSICEQREILRWMQEASASFRAHAKTA